jgi:N-acetyl-D-muramate 6-phosphate phosphatase
MVGLAFGVRPGEVEFDRLRDAFLKRYAQRLLHRTRVFEQMIPVLDALDGVRRPWGIVTNKLMRYTRPIVDGLDLQRRAAVVIAGDSTPYSKPHPAPLLEAARQMSLAPADCVYVGDDLRDVQAGRAAGMAVLAAAWGYLGEGDGIDTWGADCVLATPIDLLNWLELA